MVRGYAPGVYDLLHIGHLNVLRTAKDLCHHLTAGVVSDEVAAEAKGRLPIIPLAERLDLVGALRCVDDTYVETTQDKREAWRSVQFDVIFKGDDWRGTPKGQRLETHMAEVGARVVYLPYTLHTSSTKLGAVLDRLLSGAVAPGETG